MPILIKGNIMQAIRVSYKGATNFRQSRLVVTNGRVRLTVPYDYGGSDDHMKFEAAKDFVNKFMPFAPELNPIPCEFKNDSYFSFIPKPDPDKLDEIVTQIYHASLSIETSGDEPVFTISKSNLEEILKKLI
jgi:hypothetical protein